MQRRKLLYLLGAGVAAVASGAVLADDHGHGHGKESDDDHGHGKHDEHGNGHGKGHEKHDYRYSDRDRGEVGEYYRAHYNNLPPGLAKRDRLPPGLERQLEARGTLPPGLRKKMYRCPVDLERRLPPPPPDCEHFVIGGHIALVNRKTFVVIDLFNIGL